VGTESHATPAFRDFVRNYYWCNSRRCNSHFFRELLRLHTLLRSDRGHRPKFTGASTPTLCPQWYSL